MVGGGWAGAALAFVAVALATLSGALFFEWLHQVRERRKVQEQLRRIVDEGFGPSSPGAAALYRSKPGHEPRWLHDATERMPRLRDLRTMMEQADLKWSVQTYLTLAVGFALAAGLLVFIPTRNVLLALPAAALGAMLPNVHVKRKRARRMRAFEEHLPETIDLLGRALRAGHPLTAGLRMVAEEAAEPEATEFRRVFEEQRFGMPLDESLYALADRVPLVDVRIFLSAVLVQREVGGNLAEILDKLASVIRARFTLQRQLRVITAQGRMSGYILGALPLALGVMMLALNTDPMIRFVTSTGGRYLMMAAVILQIFGFLWIRKIVDIKM